MARKPSEQAIITDLLDCTPPACVLGRHRKLQQKVNLESCDA
jgi:lipoate-protein ligase A